MEGDRPRPYQPCRTGEPQGYESKNAPAWEPNGSSANSVSVGVWMDRSTSASGGFACLVATLTAAGATESQGVLPAQTATEAKANLQRVRATSFALTARRRGDGCVESRSVEKRWPSVALGSVVMIVVGMFSWVEMSRKSVASGRDYALPRTPQE